MRTTVKLLFFILTMTILNACTPSETSQEAQAEPAIQEVTDCPINKIPGAEAEGMIADAKTYIESLNGYLFDGGNKPQPLYEIPRGAKLAPCEMGEIVKEVGTDADVWAMMALETDEEGKKYLTIIFQCKAKDSENYVYYNFTKPCPAQCPPAIN